MQKLVILVSLPCSVEDFEHLLDQLIIRLPGVFPYRLQRLNGGLVYLYRCRCNYVSPIGEYSPLYIKPPIFCCF